MSTSILPRGVRQRLPLTSVSLAVIALTMLAVVAAIVLGFFAAVGDILIVLLFVGGIGGLLLLSRPTWLMWVTVLTAYVFAGCAWFFADFSKAEWAVYALSASFWPLVLASLISPRATWRKSQFPTFFYILGLFYFVGIVSTLSESLPTLQYFIAAKNYFLPTGFALALYFLPWHRLSILRLGWLHLGVALVQCLFTLYQYIFVRSYRLKVGGMYMGDSAVEASDSVVGTFGGAMMGGGAGTSLMPIFCCIQFAVILYLFAHNKLTRGQMALLTILLGIPMVLSETKVIFILLPIILIMAIWERLRGRPVLLVATPLAAAAVLFMGLYAYQALHWSAGGGTFAENVAGEFKYSFATRIGEDRARLGAMTRMEAILYWWDRTRVYSAKDMLFGHGMASAKSTSQIMLTPLVAREGARGLDTSTLTNLLWDTGVIGTLIFICSLCAAFRCAYKVSLSPRLTVNERAIVRSLQAACAVFVIVLPYTVSMTQTGTGTVMTFCTLGMIAYYYRLDQSLANGAERKV